MERSDRQLIDATATGDRSAYALLVQRYLNPLYRFCNWYLGDSQLAEDAVQESLLRLYRSATNGDQIREPGPWAFATARHCCQELRRQKNKHRAVSLTETDTELVTEDRQADAETEDMELLLKPLSDEQRLLIQLKHVEGLKCRQIATRLGKPLSTITASLSRAYRKIRDARKEKENQKDSHKNAAIPGAVEIKRKQEHEHEHA